MEDLAEFPELDAVVVCTPNATHARAVETALRAGKNVVCEKPLAVRAAHARRLAALAREEGRTLLVAFTNRFRPEVELLREVIRGGRLGEVYHLRAGWLRTRGVPGAGSWFTSRSAGGGVVNDLGSHLLDLLLWLQPRPPAAATVFASLHAERLRRGAGGAEWYAAAAGGRARGDVEDTAVALLAFEGGVSASLEVSWDVHAARDETWLEAVGTEGTARLSTLFGMSTRGVRPRDPLVVRGGDGEPWRPVVPGAEDPLLPYRRQLAFFAEALRERRPHLELAEAGVQAAALAEAIHRAGGTRRSVAVDLAPYAAPAARTHTALAGAR